METAVKRQSSSPSGLVRFGVPVAASRFLSPRLPLLLAQHPGLKVALVVRDQFGNMIEERLDLAMHAGEITDGSVVVRRAGAFGRVVVAAPSYLERHGKPSVPVDLADHNCLVHDTRPGSDLWSFTNRGRTINVRVSGNYIANDSSAIRLAARAGHGVALMSEVQAFDDVRAGLLVHLLPEYPLQRVPILLVYPSRRNLAPRTRVVMDFVLQQLRQIGPQFSLDVGRNDVATTTRP
jgi:DNA-binding transcriptional LysR family regulator